MNKNYYEQKLNSVNLFKVYDTNIPRVKQYLDAEISFVKNNLTGSERVLELGAGYGRIVKEIASDCESIVGIDISKENVSLSEEYLKNTNNAEVINMDIHNITLEEKFDTIICLQNGLSAMNIKSIESIRKILQLAADGGKIYFSTYSEKFWDYRLQWFEEQAEKKLLGKIDYDKTKDGVIICEDGFQATTYTINDLNEIGASSGYEYHVEEIDRSSVFLVINKVIKINL